VPSAGAFSEAFATDQRGRFDFQLHTSSNGDVPTKIADQFVGEHNMACQGPDTHRDVHGGMAAKTILDASASELSWWCAPTGDPAKGHFMTALDTDAIATLSFAPKQTFTNVTQVCWDQNMNNLGEGKWVNVFVVPADDIAAHGGNFSYAAASGVPFGGIDRTLPAGSFDFTWQRGSTFASKWGPNASHTETMNFWASTIGHGMVPEGPLDSAPRFRICLTSGGNMVINRPDGTTDTRAIGTTFPTGAVKVIFQDASYNPTKHNGNSDRVTWHWDNISVSTASTASPTVNVVPASFTPAGHDPLQMYCESEWTTVHPLADTLRGLRRERFGSEHALDRPALAQAGRRWWTRAPRSSTASDPPPRMIQRRPGGEIALHRAGTLAHISADDCPSSGRGRE
jgi:hypothetical protein